MKRVLAVLAPELPSVSGTFVYREVAQLRALGIPVQTFSLHEPKRQELSEEALRFLPSGVVYGSPLRTLRDAMLQIVRAPRASARAVYRAAVDTVRGRFSRPGQRWKVLPQCLAGLALSRRLRRDGVQHLHVHFAHSSATVGMYAAIAADLPFSVTAHANDIWVEGSLLREKARRARPFVTIAEANVAPLVAQGVSRADIRIIHCGVDLGQFARHERNVDGPILSVGRMVAKKGFDILLRAFALLPDRSRHLILAGAGPERPALERLANQLGVADRVQLPGRVTGEQVRQLMQHASCFALPCRVASSGDRDGIPVVLMEAMASGLPVISSDVGGVGELVQDGRTGRLLASDDPNDLASLLASLLAAPRTANELAHNGHRHVVAHFDAASNARLLADTIRMGSERGTPSYGTTSALAQP